MVDVPVDVDQHEWGSSLEYGDGERDPIDPRYLIIHWGGSTMDIDADREASRLRIWQRYHLSRGWRDIAYNYAVGNSGLIYRCRGLNAGGHVSSADNTPEGDPYNQASIGVVWIGGSRTSAISEAAFDAMAAIANSSRLIVKAHSTVKHENGGGTQCPGSGWRKWIHQEGWNVELTDTEWFETLRHGDIDMLAQRGVITESEAAYFTGDAVDPADHTNLRKAVEVRLPIWS